MIITMLKMTYFSEEKPMNKIKLYDIIDALETSNGMEDIEQFYDTRSGQIELYSPDYEFEITEEELEENYEYYISLPSKFDINEYSIMQDFINQIDNDEIQDQLDNAIHGRGAFRMFKDTLHMLKIEQSWYEYRDIAYKNIAIDWCKKNNISYVE